MNWRDLLLVAVGGGIGSALRYLAGKAMGSQVDVAFPWHTLAVNISGAFLIGLLVVAAARQGWPGWWRPLLAVGILGGYTTFSTFSLECVEMALLGRWLQSAGYVVLSVAGGLAAAAAGVAAGRSFIG